MQGGVSTGIYASLNCGLGSNDESGLRDGRKSAHGGGNVAGQSAPADLVTAYQVHGITVAEVETPWTPGNGPRADAMVTRRRGVALGILTADCTPVLLVDGAVGIIGAAHAGWKGAKAGVVDAVIAAMVRLGARTANIVGRPSGRRSARRRTKWARLSARRS